MKIVWLTLVSVFKLKIKPKVALTGLESHKWRKSSNSLLNQTNKKSIIVIIYRSSSWALSVFIHTLIRHIRLVSLITNLEEIANFNKPNFNFLFYSAFQHSLLFSKLHTQQKPKSLQNLFFLNLDLENQIKKNTGKGKEGQKKKSKIKISQNGSCLCFHMLITAFKLSHLRKLIGMCSLPEYSWHSLYRTKTVPHVKISRVPITNERHVWEKERKKWRKSVYVKEPIIRKENIWRREEKAPCVVRYTIGAEGTCWRNTFFIVSLFLSPPPYLTLHV